MSREQDDPLLGSVIDLCLGMFSAHTHTHIFFTHIYTGEGYKDRRRFLLRKKDNHRRSMKMIDNTLGFLRVSKCIVPLILGDRFKSERIL